MIILPIIFFFISLLYSAVGFGGGSSYIALLFLFNFSYKTIPLIALTCNLIVVSGNSYHYIKSQSVRWNFLIPFIITSIPFAFLGGTIPLAKKTFLTLLGVCLLIAGMRMIFTQKKDYSRHKIPPTWVSLTLGAIIGLISGLVGIGGGIFLSPILYNFKWGTPKEISSICSLFIFVNSISGLIGQLYKIDEVYYLLDYWPFTLAVLVGGQIGNYLSINKLPARTVEQLTALLVIFVSIRILFLT